MSAAEFTGIFFIIIKIFFGQHAILITNQAIALNFSRIEFHLQFYIFGYREKSATKLIHQYFLRFSDSVDIGMITVSFIGQFLHLGILVITHTIT